MEQLKHDGRAEAPAGLAPDRIEALADGIFAVAMTILVLDLHVPELAAGVSDAGLFAALGILAPKAVSYVCGFVILGTLWVGHRFQFNYIRRSNRVILWINLLFLLMITFLPFVISLIGAFGPTSVGCALFGATLVLANSCLLAQWLYATRPPRLLIGPPIPAEVYAGLRDRVLMGMVGYGGGLVLAPLAPRVSFFCFATTPLLYFVPSRFDRHVRSAD